MEPASPSACRERERERARAAQGREGEGDPYVKPKSNCLNLLPFESIIMPKRDVTNHITLPIKAVRSISIKLQPRPTNITGSSNQSWRHQNFQPPSNSQQQHETGSSTTEEVSRKTVGLKGSQSTELQTIGKPKIISYNQTKSRDSAILKDRVNKEFVREPQIRIPPLKPQQLLSGTNLARTGEKLPNIVKDIKVNRDKYKRPNEIKLQSHTVTEQNIKQSKPWTCPSVLQGGYSNRYSNKKQDQKSTKSVLVGNFNSVIPSTPNIIANGISGNKCSGSYQQKVRIIFSIRQLPNLKLVTKLKQLEEWQKSKGETIYKGPLTELKEKRKISEKINISFWKSMEKKMKKKKAQLDLSYKTNNSLTELELVEGDPNRITEGVTSASVVAEVNITSIEEWANKAGSENSCLSPQKKKVGEREYFVFHKNEALPINIRL
ncbi:unnamed protein product [Nyctereutes procyonoides]|uniref:(raccoon dog) hypothetical protein n=1 Tax=Nyctereutes procyonoides TaxID=34880 RepID=A0A811Y219_NYCPR|nr:unnamed protein product [Nyctereutes procyonoides]